MRFVATVLIAAGMIGGCAAPAAPPSHSPEATALAPTPAASPTDPLITPSPIPTFVPTAPPPTLAGLVPTEIDAVIELRVWIQGDVGGMGRTPNLTAYRDGTLLRSTDQGPRITRLTPEGLARLKEAAGAGGLLDSSGVIKPDPEYFGGYVSFSIELRRGGELIRRATSNSLTPADRPAGEALIARAEELVDLNSWLPADAWLVDPTHAELYIPTNLLLKITIWDNPIEGPPGETRPPMIDVADVAWPLGGELQGFGVALAEPPLGSGSIARCGPVSLADAALVQSALFEAPWESPSIPTSDRMAATLTWDAQRSHVNVSLANLLPGDALDCSLDGSWP